MEYNRTVDSRNAETLIYLYSPKLGIGTVCDTEKLVDSYNISPLTPRTLEP